MKNVKWFLIAAVGLVVLGLAWWLRPGDAVESALLAEAPYRALKRHDRANYDAVLAAYRGMRAGEIGREAYIRTSNRHFSEVVARRIATASDASAVALVRATLPVAKALQGRSADACFAFLFPEAAGAPDIGGLISASDQRSLLEMQGEVIRSSAEAPSPPPDLGQMDAPLSAIVDEMYRRYGQDVQLLSHVEDPALDRAKVCAMTVSWYELIMEKPEEISGKLIRAMAARA